MTKGSWKEDSALLGCSSRNGHVKLSVAFIWGQALQTELEKVIKQLTDGQKDYELKNKRKTGPNELKFKSSVRVRRNTGSFDNKIWIGLIARLIFRIMPESTKSACFIPEGEDCVDSFSIHSDESVFELENKNST